MRHTKRIYPKEITQMVLGNIEENELFSVVFTKKNGQKRVMRAKYSLDDKQTDKQLIVTDTVIKEFRRINTDSIKEIITKGIDFKIKKPLAFMS